jgi:hypothetical protein
MDLLYYLKAFRSEDALHQHTVGGGPSVQLGADDGVVGDAPDDFSRSTLSSGTRFSRM